MNNITSLKPAQTSLTDVNNARASHGLSALPHLNANWVVDFCPILTLNDLARGSNEVKKIVRKHAPILAAIAAQRRKDADAKKAKKAKIAELQNRKAA